MKEKFRNQRITPMRLEQIQLSNHILEEYDKQGYRLTLRQLYYQLVAEGFIPNEAKEYQKLIQTLVIGRMNGLIDWDFIEDRLRKPYLTYSVGSIVEALEDTISAYKLDRQKGQPYHIEIWTEKDAVSSILKRSSVYFHVNLMVNRGYSSCSAMYEAFRRIESALIRKQETKILYVGDHDPSGLDMLRDIWERLYEFGVRDFKVIPVALTWNQVVKYKPPPNPAKITDPRARWYIREYGEESWELDALKPDILHDIITQAVLGFLDINKFKAVLRKEKSDTKRLKGFLKI